MKIEHIKKYILLFIIIMSLIIVISLTDNSSNESKINGSLELLGKRDYGYVEKGVFGNKSSNQTIVMIIGVHPLEHGIHEAIYSLLKQYDNYLNKRFVLYKVTVTKNQSDYELGRMNGQLLARDFLVPDIESEKPLLVLDNHENRYKATGYKYAKFIILVSNDNKTKSYGNQIVKEAKFLRIYNPPAGSSPNYVTGPISKKGIPTIIYETYINDSESNKTEEAREMILILNDLEL